MLDPSINSEYSAAYQKLSSGFKAKVANYIKRANDADEVSTVDQVFSKTDDSEFIDYGADGYVFKMHDQVSTNDYVTKIFPKRRSYRDSTLSAMHRAVENDIDGVAKVVAASDQVIVQDFVEGKSIVEMNAKELSQISKEQFLKLFQTIDKLISLKIDVDTEFENFIYSPEKGFTVIDIKDIPEDLFEKIYAKNQKAEIINDLEVTFDNFMGATNIKTKKLNTLSSNFKSALEQFADC